jgi:hypothetical protein
MKALNRVIVLLAVFAAFSFVGRVQAADDVTTSGQTPTWEVTGSSDAAYIHTNTSGQSSGSNVWALQTGLGYFFNSMYELGSTISFTDVSFSGNSVKSFGFQVGPTFNFMGTPENAMFLTGQIGVLLTGNGNNNPNSTQLAYTVGVGRRVEIVKHVTWSPEVAIVGVAKNTDSTTGIVTPSSTNVEVIPFQFSLLF